MKKFNTKKAISFPDYISQRENHLSDRSNWYKDSSILLSNLIHNGKCLYSKDLYGHCGCINALEFSKDGKYLVSGGDDKYVQLWNVNEAVSSTPPTRMKTQHQSNVFCLVFDSINSKILSAGNDGQIIVHDTKTGEYLDDFQQDVTIYGLSMCPNNDSIFASGSENGKIKVFDMKSRSADPTLVVHANTAFHAVQFHPIRTNHIISANSAEGVVLWDIRQPKNPYLRYGDISCNSAMSVKFNSEGNQILALVRRNSPVLFDTDSGNILARFDAKHYYNSCTMKSGCFAGATDEFVLSGSDDFNLYMWKIPHNLEEYKVVEEPQMTLMGHRSIVNQVRFDKSNFLIATSGVEKIVKIWSPYPLPRCQGGLSASDSQVVGRKFYTQTEYFHSFGDYGRIGTQEMDGTEEDLSMLAFFDALIHREISDIHFPDLSDNSSDSDSLRSEIFHLLPNYAYIRDASSPPEDRTVDKMLPNLINNRRHRLRVKAMMEKRIARPKAHNKKLSGISTANNSRLTYNPSLQQLELTSTDEYISMRSQRRTIAPYTVVYDGTNSTSSSSCNSDDESFQPTTRHNGVMKMRNRQVKRPCDSDSSSDESESPSTKRRIMLKLSPDIGPKYELSSYKLSCSSDEETSSDRSDSTEIYDHKKESSSKGKTCCQGTGCSSKCKNFVSICQISDDDDDETDISKNVSAETAEGGIFPCSMANSASSNTQDSSNKIKFSISKAKSARQRCYRRKI